jgi:signal transduction histidine kinase
VLRADNLNAARHVVQFYGRDELARRDAFTLFCGYRAGHWGADELADDVALVVTELAANAVRHARSGFTVILSARRNALRIAVRDACPVPADGSGPGLAPAPLHGLGALDAMASRWGSSRSAR